MPSGEPLICLVFGLINLNIIINTYDGRKPKQVQRIRDHLEGYNAALEHQLDHSRAARVQVGCAFLCFVFC